MKPIKIFKVGTHTSMQGVTKNYTREMLADCVATYNPEKHEAPFVLGHPKHDDPAYGWADHLELSDDGYLLAYPKKVDAEFAEKTNAGKHNKVSASFYLPDSPNNPTPGKLYLRHVGFLGAQPPAVKGLGTVQFAENEEGVVDFMSPTYAFELISDIFRRQRDALIESVGAEEADKQFPNWVIDSLKEVIYAPMVEPSQSSFSEHSNTNTPTPPAKTAREIELEQQLATANASLAAQALAEQKSVASDFAESLVEAGQLPPKVKDKAISLIVAAQQNDQVVSFAEGETSLADGLKSFLSNLPKIVVFGEHNPKGRVDTQITQPENPLIADAKSRSA
ncbi:peptidase [Acinetobacter bereziniae]|uniref:peptidase n=1 Tax=Acinetobacter bereziniae TaxID=106648 RepID=UPI001250B25C|nr:peptidase [Acinetobacter bereziniae]